MEEKLNEIIMDLFAIEILEQYRDISFLLSPFNMSAHNFLILFMEVERKFDIKIPDNNILDMEITTYNNLLKTIYNCLKDKKSL